MKSCNVCHGNIDGPVYRSAREVAITSLCEVRNTRIEVLFCRSCGHLQTECLSDLSSYYDQDYKILIDSEDEDQLYAVIDGVKVFRADHQVSTLVRKVKIPDGAKVLDYGCAKSSTLQRLLRLRPDLEPHVFDVSQMYLTFWHAFVPHANIATYAPKAEWAGRFDLVTSFFALEHVEAPSDLVKTVFGLLRPKGQFYCIVPNVYANKADFVVADHVNHFSAGSLLHLLYAAGFSTVSVDEGAHQSAWVVVATKGDPDIGAMERGEPLDALEGKVTEMVDYWQSFSERVEIFEVQHREVPRFAIYGSGFYGTFIASCLKDSSKLDCFLDQNPHRQRQQLLGKPILPPEQLPSDITVVFVGLNPRVSREGIQSVSAWQGKPHQYFFP